MDITGPDDRINAVAAMAKTTPTNGAAASFAPLPGHKSPCRTHDGREYHSRGHSGRRDRQYTPAGGIRMLRVSYAHVRLTVRRSSDSGYFRAWHNFFARENCGRVALIPGKESCLTRTTARPEGQVGDLSGGHRPSFRTRAMTTTVSVPRSGVDFVASENESSVCPGVAVGGPFGEVFGHGGAPTVSGTSGSVISRDVRQVKPRPQSNVSTPMSERRQVLVVPAARDYVWR